MKITYFHRNPSSGYSIGKVSRTYISEIEKTEEVENVYMPCAKADPLSVIRNMWYAFKYRNKDGINHITGDVYYLALILPYDRTLLTLHDIGWFEHSKGIKRFLYGLIWHYIPFFKVQKVVCISESVARKVLEYKMCNPAKIMVISNAVDNSFIYNKHDFNVYIPRIICIGTGKQKNLYRTIEALTDITCHLRIVGVLDDNLLNHLHKYKIDYSNVYNLSDTEIVDEYKNCDIVSFVSWYEGFGMPIIEAQAIGRLVITSNISPMKEIAASGAVLVDPYNVSDIRKGFLSIINDKVLRDNLLKEGLQNVRYYNSRFVAKEYIELYKTLI